MKQRIEVRSQIEFDACVKAGNIAIIIGCSVVAWGNSNVEARENSNVVAWENSNVEARENSNVVAWENSNVVARENSNVEAWENSNVEARENSNVVARGNSNVEAWENVFIRLFSARQIKASAYVSIAMHGDCNDIDGGRQLDVAPTPNVGSEWCEHYGIDPENCDFKVDNLDQKILAGIEANQIQLDMDSWHGDSDCNEGNWCNTTHCRAGAAICLAGAPGWALESKFGSEMAGRMIYAVSRPDKPIPDFQATNEEALADMRASVEEPTIAT